MHRDIQIVVKDRVATTVGDPIIICGNGCYNITFNFDDEWNEADAKTARFKYLTDEGPKHQDRPFTGNTVEVPVLANIREVEVGVFSGELTTTTGAPIRCAPCIRCGSGEVEEPTPDKWDELMDLINELIDSGGTGGGGQGRDGRGISNIYIYSQDIPVEGQTGPINVTLRIVYTDYTDDYVTFTVPCGEKGEKGDTGAPGAPGADYVLTDEDKNEIAEKAVELIDTALLPIIGSGVIE